MLPFHCCFFSFLVRQLPFIYFLDARANDGLTRLTEIVPGRHFFEMFSCCCCWHNDSGVVVLLLLLLGGERCCVCVAGGDFCFTSLTHLFQRVAVRSTFN